MLVTATPPASSSAWRWSGLRSWRCLDEDRKHSKASSVARARWWACARTPRPTCWSRQSDHASFLAEHPGVPTGVWSPSAGGNMPSGLVPRHRVAAGCRALRGPPGTARAAGHCEGRRASRGGADGAAGGAKLGGDWQRWRHGTCPWVGPSNGPRTGRSRAHTAIHTLCVTAVENCPALRFT
jgi:hypothetical protein